MGPFFVFNSESRVRLRLPQRLDAPKRLIEHHPPEEHTGGGPLMEALWAFYPETFIVSGNILVCAPCAVALEWPATKVVHEPPEAGKEDIMTDRMNFLAAIYLRDDKCASIFTGLWVGGVSNKFKSLLG